MLHVSFDIVNLGR